MYTVHIQSLLILRYYFSIFIHVLLCVWFIPSPRLVPNVIISVFLHIILCIFILFISSNTEIDIIIPVLQHRILMYRACVSNHSNHEAGKHWNEAEMQARLAPVLFLSPSQIKFFPQWWKLTAKSSMQARRCAIFFVCVCTFCICSSQQPYKVGSIFNLYFAELKNGTQTSYSN